MSTDSFFIFPKQFPIVSYVYWYLKKEVIGEIQKRRSCESSSRSSYMNQVSKTGLIWMVYASLIRIYIMAPSIQGCSNHDGTTLFEIVLRVQKSYLHNGRVEYIETWNSHQKASKLFKWFGLFWILWMHGLSWTCPWEVMKVFIIDWNKKLGTGNEIESKNIE